MKMPPRHTAIAIAIATVAAVAALAAPAAAADLAYAAEVDSCLAAVNERVILENSNRVRHLVTDSRLTAIGYALTIETSVFSDDTERRYAVRCVARGKNAPVKLAIDSLET
jgi:hypothetical protein